MAAFYYRVWQVIPLLYYNFSQDLALLLYVLAYIICNKLHNLMCKRNLVAKIIVKYFNTFALYIVYCCIFVQTKHK